MTVPVPASRNAPCPCGSGRRYKDCHGALAGARAGAPAATALPAAAPDAAARRQALMQEALARQQAGDLAAAMIAYEAVLAETPDDFDALHMLGVVHYQRHAFDRAEALLRAAIARNPLVVAAQQNLLLLLEARRLEIAENALCRAVLPRLAHLCAPPAGFAAIAAARRPVDLLDNALVDSVVDPQFARLAAGSLGPARVHRPVTEPVLSATVEPPVGVLDATVAIVYGVAAPLAAFPALPAAATRVLVVDRDAPAALHDRLHELSDEARHAVHVRYTTPALAGVLGFPGGLLFPDERGSTAP